MTLDLLPGLLVGLVGALRTARRTRARLLAALIEAAMIWGEEPEKRRWLFLVNCMN